MSLGSLDSRPGRARGQAAFMALAAAGVLGLYLVGLKDGFGNDDEVLYAEFARTMQRTGRYLEASYGGAVVLQRPPWFTGLVAWVGNFVSGPFGLRLVPALVSAATALAAGAIAWRRFGVVAGAIALGLCAGAPTMTTYGRIVSSDPPFILACTLALGATLAALHDPRWLPWAGVALGGAFASKSLAALVPAAALAPWLAWVAWQDRGTSGARRRLVYTIAGFLLLALPYYLISWAVYGGRFLEVHFGYNLAARASGGLQGVGEGSVSFYLRHLLETGDGPLLGALLVGGSIVAVARGLGAKNEPRNPMLICAGVVSLTILALFSLIKTRLAHYLLPFYPAASIAAGAAMARALSGARTAKGRRLGEWAGIAAGIALLFYGLGRPAFNPNLAPSEPARVLGQASQAVIPEGRPVYSLDWYSPALGYYADRPWRMLTTYPSLARIVGDVDLFRAAGTVALVPPWPPGPIVVAISREHQARASGLEILRTIAESDEAVLVEARPR